MDEAVLVYTTFPDEETALAIGEALVRDKPRLASTSSRA
jgi:uncharacterized protein involved in tolerance to divalent cations